MNILVVAGGYIDPLWDCDTLIKEADYIICADSGAEHILNRGYTPDLMLGDFDSIKQEELDRLKNNDCKVIEYPPEKNYTDSELAVEFALELKPNKVTMIGFTGTRLDHTLANIHLLKSFEDRDVKASIINKNNIIQYMDTKKTIVICKDDSYKYISMVPLSETVKDVNISGVKYPLVNKELFFGQTLSISNEITNDKAYIEKKQGRMLVILSID